MTGEVELEIRGGRVKFIMVPPLDNIDGPWERYAPEAPALAAALAAEEALIADWLDDQAEAEEGRAALYGDSLPQLKLVARAGALREAAEAVRQGRARREGTGW